MWREKIESELGIYTFSFLMPAGEIDGFSYIEDGIPYAITINSRNSKNRNIFTLFHELGHIIEGHSGICITSYGKATQNSERRCDKFAAEFLLPAEQIKRPKSYEELKELASELSVSSEAYARRAYELGVLQFDEMNMLIKRIPRKKTKSNGEMKISSVVMSKSRRGEKFFNLVVDAYSSGRLSSSLMADLLQIRPTRLDKL